MGGHPDLQAGHSARHPTIPIELAGGKCIAGILPHGPADLHRICQHVLRSFSKASKNIEQKNSWDSWALAPSHTQ